MTQNGWIKIWRKITEKGWYTNSKCVHLWIHLLLKANHSPKEFMWNGAMIIIKDGQFIAGRKQLSIETGIAETTIERILNMLENEHQIGQQKTNKFRLITVINWKEYQGDGHQSGQQTDNKRTTNGHKQELKELKNDKKENNASVVSSLTGIHLGKDYAPDHHSPLDKKKALPKAPKSEKQVTVIQALKLIDYFKEQMYEIHGDDMPYLKGSAREDPKMVRLFKQGIESLGEEAPAYVDWWLMEGGEYFKFDPRVCFAKSQVEKYKAGKVMKRKSDKPLSL